MWRLDSNGGSCSRWGGEETQPEKGNGKRRYKNYVNAHKLSNTQGCRPCPMLLVPKFPVTPSQPSEMHSRTLFLLCTALLALRVLSLAHPGPTATDIASDYPDNIGWTPKPTSAPFLSSRHELRDVQKRQASLATTCGWFDGNAADPFYCYHGYACSTNLAGAYFGCCETDSAGSFLSDQCGYVATPYTGCYDYTKASACVGACATENLVWYVPLGLKPAYPWP